MSRFFQVVTREVSKSIATSVSDKQLQKIFSLIDAEKSLDEIVENGVLGSKQTSDLLLKLIAEKAVRPIAVEQSHKSVPAITLVTDSASDLPPELIEGKNIVVIPLNIAISGRKYKDGLDISSEKFYHLLKQSQTFPVTSPPSLLDFQKVFHHHIGRSDILGIFLSKKMSKTFDLAKQAVVSNYNAYLKKRNANPDLPNRFKIEIIDSCQVSMGTGLLVLEASDKIAAGWSFDEVKDHIEEMTQKLKVFFMVDNLEYLARGGRLGRGSAFLGNLFGLKPILGVEEGGVDAKSRSFGGKRGQRKLIEYMKEDLSGVSSNVRFTICHADAPKKAETVKNLVSEAFPDQQQIVSSIGPIAGAHLGPGAVAVGWLAC